MYASNKYDAGRRLLNNQHHAPNKFYKLNWLDLPQSHNEFDFVLFSGSAHLKAVCGGCLMVSDLMPKCLQKVDAIKNNQKFHHLRETTSQLSKPWLQ